MLRGALQCCCAARSCESWRFECKQSRARDNEVVLSLYQAVAGLALLFNVPSTPKIEHSSATNPFTSQPGDLGFHCLHIFQKKIKKCLEGAVGLGAACFDATVVLCTHSVEHQDRDHCIIPRGRFRRHVTRCQL